MENSEVLGDWDEYEQGTSSTWRETEAVSRLVRSHVNVLKHSFVTVYSDNKNVKSILLNGSSKPHIQDIAINLNYFCDSEKITCDLNGYQGSKTKRQTIYLAVRTAMIGKFPRNHFIH